MRLPVPAGITPEPGGPRGSGPALAGIELSEWRLVGPGLAALIVALALRFRLSRARIQEFLGEWLGLDLSIGTIHQTIHEASAAVAPAEEELIQAVLDSDLLHADETSWPEAQQTLWLWVFVAATVTLYYVAGRGKELVENVLDGFTGWLMSDGWMAYRHYPRRLRCWAHLIRKARGLAQSCDREARAFGQLVLDHPGSPDGGGVRRPRRPAPGRSAHPARAAVGRVARRLRAAPRQPSSENPCLGGGVAQRLGGHLPGAEPSRAPADQQRRRARLAALGDPAQAQSGHPHRGGLARRGPARQRHRHLPSARHSPWRYLERAIADAWIDPDSIKVGYEISFARYFYKPTVLRTLEEIRADILALERDTEGLLHRILEVSS